MTAKPTTVKEAIELAIKEEQKAYDLYKNTSEIVNHSGTKLLLLEMAEQELEHRRLLETVIQSEKFDSLGENIPQQSPGITQFLVESELKANASPQEVMIFAIKAEEKAHNFYKDLENHFVGSALETLFRKLAAEERGHKAKLENEYEAHFLGEF